MKKRKKEALAQRQILRAIYKAGRRGVTPKELEVFLPEMKPKTVSAGTSILYDRVEHTGILTRTAEPRKTYRYKPGTGGIRRALETFDKTLPKKKRRVEPAPRKQPVQPELPGMVAEPKEPLPPPEPEPEPEVRMATPEEMDSMDRFETFVRFLSRGRKIEKKKGKAEGVFQMFRISLPGAALVSGLMKCPRCRFELRRTRISKVDRKNGKVTGIEYNYDCQRCNLIWEGLVECREKDQKKKDEVDLSVLGLEELV